MKIGFDETCLKCPVAFANKGVTKSDFHKTVTRAKTIHKYNIITISLGGFENYNNQINKTIKLV